MSVRLRPRVATAAALSLAAAGAAVLPAQAAFAVPPQPLTLTVSHPTGHGPLLPGGSAKTFTMTVSNPTSKPQSFTGGFSVVPQGVLPVTTSDVSVSVTPLHAPATSAQVTDTTSGLFGAFNAKVGRYFTIAPHSSDSWTVRVAATKAWPLNDNSLTLDIGSRNSALKKTFDFKVGTAVTGGPLVATLTGSNWLSRTHPMVETLTLTNRTGAAIKSGIWRNLVLTSSGSGWQTLDDCAIGLNIWENGHWEPWTDANLNVGMPFDLAKGAQGTITVRYTLLNDSMPTPSGHFKAVINGGINGAVPGSAGTFQVDKVITVYR
jgi:hypothetical protein